MNPRKILNAAREGIGDPEEIRRALVECGELDGGSFEVVLRWRGVEGHAAMDRGRWHAGTHERDSLPLQCTTGQQESSPAATSKHLESEYLSYRLGGKL